MTNTVKRYKNTRYIPVILSNLFALVMVFTPLSRAEPPAFTLNKDSVEKSVSKSKAELATQSESVGKFFSAIENQALVRNDQLQAVQARDPVVPEVDRLDREAYEAQTKFYQIIAKGTSSEDEVLEAFRRFAQAEAGLEKGREDAWNAFPQISGSVLIYEPMQLAMLDLHIEVRRRLGPDFHTVVPGLVDDRGCVGDFVADRLIFRYGTAAAGIVKMTLDNGSDATIAALEEMAVQIACVSMRQLAELENAVANGFEAVSERMVNNGFENMIPAFVRLVAPIQILILDAGKHRGERSASWKWFDTYSEVLAQGVAVAEWATKDLFVWDRRHGVLVGFPSCAPGNIGPDCVDMLIAIESLSDPRSIGLGDCGLAGMLSTSTVSMDGDQRYTCPSIPCGSPQLEMTPEVNPIQSNTSPIFGIPGSNEGGIKP